MHDFTLQARMKQVSMKLETIKTMKAIGFIKQDAFELILNEMTDEVKNWDSKISISKRRLKAIEKRIHHIIDTGLQNANCNLFLTNIPTEACLQNSGDPPEPVFPEHIFDTLVHYGGHPNYVLQIGPDSFVADLPSYDHAKKLKEKLHGMCMNGNAIRLYALTKRRPGPLDIIPPSVPLKVDEKQSDFWQKTFFIGFISLLFTPVLMMVYLPLVHND